MLLESLVDQWIVKTFQSYLEDKERQIYLTRILSFLTQSKQLWSKDSPLYEEALQQTLRQFCQDFNISALDIQDYGEWSKLIQSFNRRLQQRLQRLEAIHPNTHRFNPNDDSPDSRLTPPPLVVHLYDWVRSDRRGDLKATHLPNYPAANCQTLIERRLPPEQSWEDIAAEVGLSVAVISEFYQRECLPRLRRCAIAKDTLARLTAC